MKPTQQRRNLTPARNCVGGDEALHFYELVHVLQWRTMGPERFVSTHADGVIVLATAGYATAGALRFVAGHL